MTSPDLDLSIAPSAEQIRRREFATIRRGYDPDQVKAYLSQIAQQIETLEEQVRVAKLESSATSDASNEALAQAATESAPAAATVSAPEATDPYLVASAHMADLIRSAESHAEQIRRDSEEEAQRVLEEARTEADDIRLDAQSKAEAVRQEAGEMLQRSSADAEKMVSGLTAKRDTLLSELEHMRERLMGVAKSLEAIASESSQKPTEATPSPVNELFDPPAATSAPQALASSSTAEVPDAADLFADPDFAELWDVPSDEGTPPLLGPDDGDDT
jgi:DivIVA domain-containing protein